MEGSKVIASDVDDVLVHIVTPWLEKAIAKSPRIAAALASLPRDRKQLQELVEARRLYHFQDWLPEHGFSLSMMDELENLYRNDPHFYDDLAPTAFCRSIVHALSFPRAVAQVHLITQCYDLDEPATQSKVRWLEKQFGKDPRVTIHLTVPGQKKSDVLLRNCPEADAYADDARHHVIDVLTNDRVRPAEILYPQMGHNVPTPDMVKLAVLKRVKLSPYQNVA